MSGRGLAGVITQMSLNYDQGLWGTTPLGDTTATLRAPMFVGVTLNFAPIHDLPLGLTERGELFAPSHPVGILSEKHPKMKALDVTLSVPDEELARAKEAAVLGVGRIPSKDETKDPGNPFSF